MRRSRFSNPEHTLLLGSPAWARCEERIAAFEQAWTDGTAPVIGDFLEVDGSLRRPLLLELVHIDLEFRLKANQSAMVESYLTAFPELAGNRPAVLDLIEAEFALRRLDAEAQVRECGVRFPDYATDFTARSVEVSDDTDDYIRPGRSGPPKGPIPGYEILAEIGRGGMGVVYRAREPNLGREVALKFLPDELAVDPDRLQRFLREARTASGLNHPNICTVHTLGEHRARPFIVLELVDGQTLTEFAAGRPELTEIVRVIRQAARALAAAHAAGVIHRDIKPENIMVRPDGYVKVLDFGLARRLPTARLAEPGADTDSETDPGKLIGTAAYMSPEQARGESLSAASDIFSLGIVLYELATGRHPFEADSAIQMLTAIDSRRPIAPSRLNAAISASLEGLIEAMLNKDARLRPTASEVEASLAPDRWQPGRTRTVAPPAPIIHREPELEVLRTAFDRAEHSSSSYVCILGEPGIGKTTLVEDFLNELSRTNRPAFVARGHCSERLAGAEAYLPALDALAGLLRDDPTGSAARLMKVLAPTWHGLLTPSDDTGGSGTERAASQSALVREFVSLLQELTRLAPLVLFIDDIHWADISTVDLLAHVGRYCHSLRLLAIVTGRQTELLLEPHPFRRAMLELQGKGKCRELPLSFLPREDIDQFLNIVFPGNEFPKDLADLIFARTEGSPLFVADLLRYLRERGTIVEAEGKWTLAGGLPDLRRELPLSIRSMIQRKLDRLDELDRRLLAAASVQGNEFDSAVLADALSMDAADVEERLQTLDRIHGLVRMVRESEFPDRTLSLRYAFVHILYQQAFEASLSPSRRAALGSALAGHLERHHGECRHNIAAGLACLYEVARDYVRAARLFHIAAQNDARIFAHREAVATARRGLRLLESLPESQERAALELPMQTTLGLQLQVTDGFAAPEAGLAYARARELARIVPDAKTTFPILWGHWLFLKVRSDLPQAQEMAQELMSVAQSMADSSLALQSHQALGITAFCRGEPSVAVNHVEQAAALYDPETHHTHAFLFGQDPAVICKAFGAVALWLLGNPDQARRLSENALEMSLRHSPSSEAVACHFAAMLNQLRGDPVKTRSYAAKSAAIAEEHGFAFWAAGARILGGWALAQENLAEGIREFQIGLREWQATGSVTYETYYLGLLCELLARLGQVEEASGVLDDAHALVARTDERFYEAELQRLGGELLLIRTSNPWTIENRLAEEYFRKAMQIARNQGAQVFELRAAMSLARLGARLGKPNIEPLAEIVGRFQEGFDTPDLHEARRLLAN